MTITPLRHNRCVLMERLCYTLGACTLLITFTFPGVAVIADLVFLEVSII